MLTEIAVTPSVLDHRCNRSGDWTHHVRRLSTMMFPENNASPVLCSNIGGAWESEVQKMLASGAEGAGTSEKILAMGLLTKMKGALVDRAKRLGEPADENDWVNEYVDRRHRPAIGRVLATDRVSLRSASAETRLFRLNQVHGKDFWQGIRSSGYVSMCLEEQLCVLLPILTHAKFLAVALPRLHSSELMFATALVRNATARGTEFGSVMIDLHTGKLNSDDILRVTSRLKEIKRASDVCERLRLILWDKVRERELLAGDLDESGVTAFRHRWGMAFQHVATSMDRKEGDEAFWSLCSDEDRSKLFNRLYGKRAAGKSSAEPLVVWQN